MTACINKLIDILRQENDGYAAIAELSEKKIALVKSSDVEALDSLIREEQNALMRFAELENKRSKCLDDLSAEMNTLPPNPTLLDIVDAIEDQSSKDTLISLHQNLAALIRRITKTNDINRRLIEDRLEYINFTLDCVTDSQQNSNNYGSMGASNKRKKLSILDRKI